jgi:hypothetical protein
MNVKRKIVKSFVYAGLGFTVEIRDVELVLRRGAWTPDVNLGDLSKSAFFALAMKPAPLTGAEVFFIRNQMRLSLVALAGLLRLTHPTVLKWEKARDRATTMAWGTECLIRLAVLDASGIGAMLFVQAYRAMSNTQLNSEADTVMVYDPAMNLVEWRVSA